MSLEIRIINFKLAMKRNKPKNVVRYKFRKYMEEYDEMEKTIGDKIRHRELALDYFRYMAKSSDNNDK